MRAAFAVRWCGVPDSPALDAQSVPTRRWWQRHRLLSVVLAALALLAVAIGTVVFTPLFDGRIDAVAAPTGSYDRAMDSAAALRALDGSEVNPVCRSQVIDQGARTERAVVLLHGYTNCPAQYDQIAQAYADAGYSVVVPRLPGHGDRDRLSSSLSDVTPTALVQAAEEALDIATGLADDVTVVGMSGGGTLAGYLAGHRDEIDRAVLIAPLVAPKVLPEFAVAPVARASRFLPDVYLWWDNEQKDALADPPYAYPRYSLRSLGAFLAVGRAAQSDQPRETTLEELVVVTNENDNAVSNAGVGRLASALASVTDRRVDEVFPAELGFGHDLIDPRGENADNISVIYPVIGPLMGLPELTSS